MKGTDLLGRPRRSGQKSIVGQKLRWPPFSLFNAREGEWQDRKREWLSLGIRSELGREDNLAILPGAGRDIDLYRHLEGTKKRGITYNTGGPATLANSYRVLPGARTAAHNSCWLGSDGKPIGGAGALNGDAGTAASQTGTSVFDPVLCELFYRWFVPVSGLVVDPFAGGSVRGIVASVTGRDYIGLDLRPEQAAANDMQANAICVPGSEPNWLVGDARHIRSLVHENVTANFKADALFTCPPYFDLERYSDDPRDLSNLSWEDFQASLKQIITDSVALVADDRFLGIVIGDIRDKEGYFRNLPSFVIKCFTEAGCRLWNQMVLVTAVGSLALRIVRQFSNSRKIGLSHQHILVFAKGDAWQAVKACEPIETLTHDFATLVKAEQVTEQVFVPNV